MIPSPGPPERRPGWTEPLPRRIPPPTWSPFGLAFGLVILGLGLVASGLVVAMGAAIAIAAAVAWIRELGHELHQP